MHNCASQKRHEQVLAQVHSLALIDQLVPADRQEAIRKQNFELHDNDGPREGLQVGLRVPREGPLQLSGHGILDLRLGTESGQGEDA